MKFKGKSLVQKNSSTVSIKKGDETFEFIVTPLPMGFWPKMQSVGLSVYPSPKKIPLFDSKGVAVRNRDTGKVEVVDDTDDPQYKTKVALVSRRVRAVQLVYLLRDDPNVEWESKEPTSTDPKEWEAYADSILNELGETSLTDEEIAEILTEGDMQSVVIDIEKVADEELLTPTQD